MRVIDIIQYKDNRVGPKSKRLVKYYVDSSKGSKISEIYSVLVIVLTELD